MLNTINSCTGTNISFQRGYWDFIELTDPYFSVFIPATQNMEPAEQCVMQIRGPCICDFFCTCARLAAALLRTLFVAA